MIKPIVLDADGTLVPDGSPDLDSEVSGIILKLREKGIRFVTASGRPWANVGSTFEPVKKKTFYVANNGAHIGCYGRCLYAYTAEHELAHYTIRKVHMHPELETVYVGVSGDYLDPKDDTLCDWLANGYKFNVIRVRDVLELEEPYVKTSIYKEEGIETVTRDIYGKSKDQAKMAYAGDMWVDCMAKDVNKGETVCITQESLGTKTEETMAFGDQLNDIEMPNQTHYSFAVANAREKIRRAARFQVDSNVWGGVLKILKGLL